MAALGGIDLGSFSNAPDFCVPTRPVKSQDMTSSGKLAAASELWLAPIVLRRMFSESRMRENRLSGLMRGGSWPTYVGPFLPTLPSSGNAQSTIGRLRAGASIADSPT